MDFNPAGQEQVVKDLKRRFGTEYDRFPPNRASAPSNGFHLDNGMFGSVDAELLYGMVRRVKPRHVVEVGAGWTSLVIADALVRNAAQGHPATHVAVDPVAPGFAYKIPGLRVVNETLQARSDVLDLIEPGDMVVADTSHIYVPGHEIDVLLQKMADWQGVHVHFHDVFLPNDYPDSWADRHYDEQGHIEAFMEANATWEVTLAANYLHHERPELLERAIKSYDPDRPLGPGSIWLHEATVEAEPAPMDAAVDPEAPHIFRSDRGGTRCLDCGMTKKAKRHV